MENLFSQIFAVIGGAVLLLLALFALNQNFATRLTEAVLDFVEVRLAMRAKGRAARAGERVHLSPFAAYGASRAHR